MHKNARIDIYGNIYVVYKGEIIKSKNEDTLVLKLQIRGLK